MSYTDYALATPPEAANLLSRLARFSTELLLEVQEDRCFCSDDWLQAGTIRLFPVGASDSDQSNDDPVLQSVCNGQYTWAIPTLDELAANLRQVMVADGNEGSATTSVKEAFQDVIRRLLLLLPTFDVDSISSFPLQRPVTLVVDTSAVLQGGLDFATRFLYPMARIKIPAIVPVEIVNMADQFLSLRRSEKLKPALCLREHLKSQGAQRALLRLELSSSIEVERPLHQGDPSRTIWADDVDREANSRGLKTVHRSFADRQIIDSAREHLMRLSPGHPIYILTSDQGLARTALSEGINPMYFEARKTSSPFGRTLTGTLYHPFTAGIYTVPLTHLLWELATCFGSARLRSPDSRLQVQVTAIGEQLSWSPYQSRDDLLWCRISNTLNAQIAGSRVTHRQRPAEHELTSVSQSTPSERIETGKRSRITSANKDNATRPSGLRAYVVSAASVIRFINRLHQETSLTAEETMRTVGVANQRSLSYYRAILTDSGLATKGPSGSIVKTKDLDTLVLALLSEDWQIAEGLMSRIESFTEFLDYVEHNGQDPNWVYSQPLRHGSLAGYRSLAEIVAAVLPIPQTGIRRTNNVPPLNTFVELALEEYQAIAKVDPWVLTGAWLEALAWNHRIHPIRARRLLEQAYNSGLLQWFFEGSTPETRYENHAFDTVENVSGSLNLRRYHLYRGDFLRSERASVRLRLEEYKS